MSSPLSLTVTPGKVFQPGEILSYDQLNLLGAPIINLSGQLGTAQLENQSVTTQILADGAVTAVKCAPQGFTPNGTGTGPFAAGWQSAMYEAQFATPVSGRVGVVVTNHTASNTKADITAAQISLGDGTGNYYFASSVSLTVDITANGNSNGLDTLPGTGAAASTWYYFYVIVNPTNNTVQGLISASATSLTLPSGFTFFALVGAVYNNASSQFQTFRVQNRRVYTVETVLLSAFAATTSWAQYTTNVNTAVPPIATAMYGTLGITSSGGGFGVAGDANGTGAQYAVGAPASSTLDSFEVAANFTIPLITSQTIYIKASGTAAQNRAVCTGYEF